MNLIIYRPAPLPDLDTEQAGRVWYYLTDAGMKMEDGTAYVYAKEDIAGWSVYGGECHGYIYADDTDRSWENVCAQVEAQLRTVGFIVADRPAHLTAVRNEDGTVRGEAMRGLALRHLATAALFALQSGATPDDLRRTIEEVIHADALALARTLAPEAKWECDPQGLGYPDIGAGGYFAGVSMPRGVAELQLSVGDEFSNGRVGWREKTILLADVGVARAEALRWLRGTVSLSGSDNPRVRARAVSAKACLAALGWT